MRTVVTWLTEKLPSGWAWAGVGAARTAAMRVSPMASARTGRAGRLSATRVTLPAICAVNVTQVVRWLTRRLPEQVERSRREGDPAVGRDGQVTGGRGRQPRLPGSHPGVEPEQRVTGAQPEGAPGQAVTLSGPSGTGERPAQRVRRPHRRRRAPDAPAKPNRRGGRAVIGLEKDPLRGGQDPC